MFEHLVESGSHSEDLKRKGSFLLGFAGIYVVLIVAFGIAGIMWATASIDQQNLELTALIAPVPVQAQQQKQEAKPEKVEITKNVDVRKELIADVSRAELVPKEVSAKASDIPPVRKGVVTMVGSSNSNAIAPVAPGAGTGNIISGTQKVDVAEAPPPPPPKPTPPKAPISGGVLNGKAVRLVQPPYPAIARSAHAAGQVRVQITIDENGNVVSAAAVSGHPLLQGAAVAAARQSKFTPTKLSGMPVKVTGVIIYNFVAQ
ncbi:MAG TPA: energy transducer TonB [Pyrinomonadaceae bacterium]|jgi:periplasmic protein TonB|nr:energy transducer TonB [Pyrinomonadaceae bacterium]